MSRPLVHRAGLGALAASLSLSLVAPAAWSAPGDQRAQGRGPEASVSSAAAQDRADVPDLVEPARLQMPTSYPYQPELRVYPRDPADRSYVADLVGHADLAPRLNALMEQSDRVSTQVIGQSTEGRDLYLVTVTAPERVAETRMQSMFRERIQHEPVKAARDRRLKMDYKTPIWFTANIHGNEWEGTDALLSYIEELALAPEEEVGELLEGHRLYFSLTLNPDGRFAGTRATALGFDANRDQITNTTPESRSFIRTTQELLALFASDIHGYTGILQVEPTGPPHGENFEYDLFLPHNYALALQIEQDVVGAQIPGNPLSSTGGIRIPYRDIPSGWDDYPPIFTAQYAAFFGSLSSTVELPLGRVSGGVQTPERAAVNVAVADQVIRTTVDYVSTHSDELLDGQIEFYRRALSNQPKVPLTAENIADVPGPDQWKPLWDVTDDQDPVELPRAYVIPVGEGQRSLSDATRLVEQLLAHDIEVRTLQAPTTLGGVTYPRGSYVVDMQQPLRALANGLLDLGTDISDKVPSMYDISAWSYSYLWGATVDKVGAVTEGRVRGTQVVTAPTPQASVPSRPQHLSFEVAGVEDFVALNDLLADDAVAWLVPSGRAVVAPESHQLAVNAALEHDLVMRPATREERAAVEGGQAQELDALTVGYTGNQDHRESLAQLGFETVPVSAASITADPAVLADLDVLWLGAGLNFTQDQANGREALQAWLDDGHGVAGAGSAAFASIRGMGLVSATGVPGQGSGNGIVAVDTPEGSIFAPHPQDSAFVYPALSFTELGEGTAAEQRYAEGNPLLAGHWRATNATNGPLAAAGNASVISAEADSGARAVVFGTSVFFRTHPKGGQSQAATALFWSAGGQ